MESMEKHQEINHRNQRSIFKDLVDKELAERDKKIALNLQDFQKATILQIKVTESFFETYFDEIISIWLFRFQTIWIHKAK